MPYNIQGNPVAITAEPVLHEGKHYIPLREIVEALGGTVTFNNNTKVAQAVIGPWNASVPANETSIQVTGNGRDVPVTLTAPPVIHEDTMYVPFDFLRDAFGYQVTMQNGTLSVVNPNQVV